MEKIINTQTEVMGIGIPTEFPDLKEVVGVDFDISPTSSFGFKLGISKGELGPASLSYLESLGWVIPDGFRDREYILDTGENKISRMSGNDLTKLVTKKMLNFAIVGADKILEAQLKNMPVIPIKQLGFKKSRLCLEVPDSIPETQDIGSIVKSATIVISEKLQNVSKYFIEKRYEFKVEDENTLTLDGSLEAGPGLLSDTPEGSVVIDIVDSGRTANANKLRVADVITNIPGAYLITNNDTLQRLRNRKGVKKWEKR